MALLKWKINNKWVTMYADAIQNRLRKDRNLSDLPDKEQARTNLGLEGDNIATHNHDDRYLPLINEAKAMVDKQTSRFSIRLTGGAQNEKIVPDSEGAFNLDISKITATGVIVNPQADGVVGLVGIKNNTYNLEKSDLTYSKDAQQLNVTNVQAGTVRATNIYGEKVYGAVWNDYAEFFPRGNDDPEPGDIIMLDISSDKEAYIKAKKGGPVVGVYTDEAATIIGGEKPPVFEDYFDYNIEKYIPIALAGRVHVNFVGRAIKGEYVVTCTEEPGCGRLFDPKHDSCKDIVGFLVEDDDKTEKRRLRIKVK